MEPGAPAGKSQRPTDHAAGPSQTPVQPTNSLNRMSMAPTAGPSRMPMAPTAGPSWMPAEPIAGPSRRYMAPTTGPSQRPVERTAGPSWMPVEPIAGPSWRSMAPTAGPSQRPVEPIAGPSRRSMTPTAGPSSSSTSRHGVTVRIVEQPTKNPLKFRYESENRIPAPIPGASSTEDRRTYPAIEITGHIGTARIVVSCLTKDEPYRPHPHKLAGHGYESPDGVFAMEVDITPENRVVTFSNIGIVCVAKKDVTKSLALRKLHSKVDPFRTGFDHGASMQTSELRGVRLCFQVYLEIGKEDEWLTIVSDVINKNYLEIIDHSCIFGSAGGGTKVMLVCEKIETKDVEVSLYSEECVDGKPAWSKIVHTEDLTIYHKFVVVFRTPPYRDPATRSTITAYMQLRRATTGETSNSIRFTYEPSGDPGPDYIEKKRRKPVFKKIIETLRNRPQSSPQFSYDDDLKADPCEIVPPASMDLPPAPDEISHQIDLNPPEINSDSFIDNLSVSENWNMKSDELADVVEDLGPIKDLRNSFNETENLQNSDS